MEDEFKISHCVQHIIAKPEPNLISMDKTYYIRKDMEGSQPKPGAKPVRVLCVDRKNDTYPVVYTNDAGCVVFTNNKGYYINSNFQRDLDLIEHKPLRKVKYYLNKHGRPASPDGYEKDSYIFQNEVEYTFDGNKLVDVKLLNE